MREELVHRRVHSRLRPDVDSAGRFAERDRALGAMVVDEALRGRELLWIVGARDAQ